MKNLYQYIFFIIVAVFCCTLESWGQTIPGDKNAVIHSRFRVSTTSETDASDPNKALINVAYSDGLGRGTQTVGYQQSPTNKDIVSGAVEFDKFGRVIRTALASPSSTNTGTYQTNAFNQATSFYGDTYAYSATTTFDNSPLNRVREQYGAGNAWRTATKPIQSFDESAGTDVRYYYLDASGNIVLSGTYPANSLFKKRVIDEQGHTSIEISDKRGRLIQKQIQDDSGYITTYYIYDGLGRILAVIQPEGYELGTGIVKNSTEWQKWVFWYEYDYRGRMHLKHVPASGDEYMVYDKWDRLVWSQTPLQREVSKWTFYKYDAFNREIIRGEKSESRGLSALETEAWGWQGVRYEIRVEGGIYYSHSNAYPQIFLESLGNIRQITYYDNYKDWVPAGMAFDAANTYHELHASRTGLPTGSRSRNSENSNWLVSVNYYDAKNRIIQTFSHNLYGQIDRTDFKYNFAGEAIEIKSLMRDASSTAITQLERFDYDHTGRKTAYKLTMNDVEETIATYEYDEIGRLKTKKIYPDKNFDIGGVLDYINRPPSPTANTNDVANKAIILNTGTLIDAASVNSYSATIETNSLRNTSLNGLQTIDYTYHIRGGLRGINLDASGNLVPNSAQGDLFSYKLDYETAGFYNGNIGKQSWQSVQNNASVGLRSYTFNYDASSRLLAATYAGINGENYSLSDLTYDKNGNIKTLLRKGKKGSTFGDIDELTYTYDGNRLLTVSDKYTDNHEVDLVPRGNGAYTYYTDGSLKSDANEQIANITYDTYLKQPKQLNLTDGRSIEYYYDGAGALLKMLYSTNESWEYGGKLIYKNGVRFQISQQEGRLIYENEIWKPEFQYTDHLGNTRVAFRANGTQLEKVSDTAFDPWGVVLNGINQTNSFQNRFEYQGKEKESTFNLNRINLGARTLNPTIGRFDRVDPLAVINESFSTFAANDNNPISFIDPDGMDAQKADDFAYSDGYSNLSTRNSTGSVGFSGVYKTNGQDGCPPNCGGDPNTPYNAGSNLKPASQQNATLSQGKFIKLSPEDEAAQLGADMAGVVEGGVGLVKIGASLLKNGLKVAKNWFQFVKVGKRELDVEKFANEIVSLNRTTEGKGSILSTSPSSIIESAMYYSSPAEQGSAIFRSIISNHLFQDGNKRTAVMAFQSFAKQFGLKTVNQTEMMNVATQVATGTISDVSQIAKLLVK